MSGTWATRVGLVLAALAGAAWVVSAAATPVELPPSATFLGESDFDDYDGDSGAPEEAPTEESKPASGWGLRFR